MSKRAGHANLAITAAIYAHALGEGEMKAALIGDDLLLPAPITQDAKLPADKGPVKG
ncbi:MAG TPA: hypothetical protein VJP60_05865 [Rhizomicrobium sp.]|nr:hypothetical protein [Rhizomicrobium sp.]